MTGNAAEARSLTVAIPPQACPVVARCTADNNVVHLAERADGLMTLCGKVHTRAAVRQHRICPACEHRAGSAATAAATRGLR